MKSQKSLLSFVISNIKNETKTQILLFAYFAFPMFSYYTVKSVLLFIEYARAYQDGFTIPCIVMLVFIALLVFGNILAIMTIWKDTPLVFNTIKNKYYSYLYVSTSEEILKYYSIRSDIRDKISGLLELQVKKSEISYYICMSDIWRKQDSHIQYLFQEEKYEELAALKRADETRIEFERTNNFEILKNSAEEAISESERLQNSLGEINKVILALEKKENDIYQKLGLKR